MTIIALAALLAVPASAGLESAAASARLSFQATAVTPLLKFAPAAARFTTSSSDEDQLIRLLDDSDPAIRAEAARSLRNYALNSYRAENALIQVVENAREQEGVRREAVKSLAWAAQHHNTKAVLQRLAENDGEAETLRAVAAKSLYVVSNDFSVRASLVKLMEDSREKAAVREGAAWGLMNAAANEWSVRTALTRIAEDSRQDAGLRVEAIKTLYGTLGNWESRNAVERLARDSGTPEAVRETAVLCLHAANHEWTVKSFLEDLSRSGPAKMRVAAVKAMQAGPSYELARYFHLSHYLGRFIDPLQDQ